MQLMKIHIRKTRWALVAAALGLAALALGAGALWYVRWQQQGAAVPCAQQQPARFSAACLAQSQAAAGRGERAAMAALAEYYWQRDPALAVRWTRSAAMQGEPASVARVLAACGEGKPFSAQDAQAVLAQAPAMEALHFRLGGSCAQPDIAAARALAPAALLAAPDSAGLCKVAVRYGLLRLSREGGQLDAQGAQQLLAECERRPQAAASARKQAYDVRQMLAREIKPVRVSVD
jgi:hypothetical protein